VKYQGLGLIKLRDGRYLIWPQRLFALWAKLREFARTGCLHRSWFLGDFFECERCHRCYGGWDASGTPVAELCPLIAYHRGRYVFPPTVERTQADSTAKPTEAKP